MNRQEYLFDVIKSFVISEKSQRVAEVSKDAKTYVLKVLRTASKADIKQAVEASFDVKVDTVNTLNMSGKVKRSRHGLGRCKDWKKAYVTLAPGETLDDQSVAVEKSAE
ncbi:MAG: 50S ribosomal protein L23 [Succinivibrionaceae bacterium]|jgi:large subunit ribosomal protein L23|nr:50S ribosomal protein L23 [Succinivibrionaceae bacterium]MBQ8977490.1 50S ribosomal protein L23 [Succinivibrionaceae bacterium]